MGRYGSGNKTIVMKNIMQDHPTRLPIWCCKDYQEAEPGYPTIATYVSIEKNVTVVLTREIETNKKQDTTSTASKKNDDRTSYRYHANGGL